MCTCQLHTRNADIKHCKYVLIKKVRKLSPSSQIVNYSIFCGTVVFAYGHILLQNNDLLVMISIFIGHSFLKGKDRAVFSISLPTKPQLSVCHMVSDQQILVNRDKNTRLRDKYAQMKMRMQKCFSLKEKVSGAHLKIG